MPLDPVLHSQVRLAIMSSLVGVEYAEFAFLKVAAGTSDSNLSVQLSKLQKAGYININKSYRDKKPITYCSMTPKGIDAFKGYVKSLRGYIE